MRVDPVLARALAALAGCGSKPRAPDWQMNAHGALERYVNAYMSGNARVEASEFERARSELESTGQPGLVARAELTRCALRVASLVFEPCEGFERLRADSPAAERAYADYLAGTIAPADVALLPPQHRAAARRRAGPLPPRRSRIRCRAWSRPACCFAGARPRRRCWCWRRKPPPRRDGAGRLLAWLGVQAQRAEQAGAVEEAQRLRRRMALAAEAALAVTSQRPITVRTFSAAARWIALATPIVLGDQPARQPSTDGKRAACHAQQPPVVSLQAW